MGEGGNGFYLFAIKKVFFSPRKIVKHLRVAYEEAEANMPVIGNDTGVVTTQDETDACNIIKAIAAADVSPDRVVMRDAKSYCAILFDDNNRKPLCRLFFNNAEKKQIVLFDGPQEEKFAIDKISELYNYRERILATVKKYLEP